MAINIYQTLIMVLGTTEVVTPPYVPPAENNTLNNTKNRLMLGVG